MTTQKTKSSLDINTLVPKGKQLFPYQQRGVRKILESPNPRILLADEMGLGKSPQAIVCRSYWRPLHTVIIAPAIMLRTWQHELANWALPTIPTKPQLVTSSKDKPSPTSNLTIISYDLAVRTPWLGYLSELLTGQGRAPGPNLLILDEAHYLKSLEAKRTLACAYKLAPLASHLLMLTGTPITKSVMDLYPLINMAAPREIQTTSTNTSTTKRPFSWQNYHKFADKFAFKHSTPWGRGYEYRGLKNLPELKMLLSPFMIRRKKEAVLKDLPQKRLANIYLPITLPPEHLIAQKKLESHIKQTGQLQEPSSYSTLRRELGILKIPSILAWLEEYRLSQPLEPIVIFAHHRDVIDTLAQRLRSTTTLTIRVIKGDTPLKARHEIITHFQQGGVHYLLCNIQAAGVGISLTRASTCLFAELDWTPASLDQALARLHRIGQQHPVIAYFLLAEDSLDTVVAKVVQKKITLSRQVLDDAA